MASLNDTAFIRNGREYSPANAANFIALAATRSSTSGKPYLIRPKGAAEIACPDYLKAQLKLMETVPKS